MEITLENVSLSIKKNPILKDISIVLPQSRLIMLLGENGAGKTQLIKAIMGFNHTSSGRICYNNVDIKDIDIKSRAKFVSYVPQGDYNDVHYTVWDFVSMGVTPHLGFYRAPTEIMKQKINSVIKKVGIEKLKDKFTNEISGGEYRLAYLARALVQDTPWMILDEPIASLDYGKQHGFLKLLKDTAVKENRGTLMSIHDPSLACLYADIIILIKDGKILDTINFENNAYPRLEKGLRMLYGNNLKFEETLSGKVLVWKEN